MEHKFSELVTQLGSQLKLSEDELSKLLPSGTQEIFTNRVGWPDFT
jgi:restriction system protein